MRFHMLLALICQLWLTTGIYAGTAIKDYHKAPRGWHNVGPAPPHHALALKIGLVQGNFQELVKQLYEVSDPRHERYGQYLSSDQVDDLVRPKIGTLEAVEEWLRGAGIDISNAKYNSARSWISIPVSVGVAEALLDTEYFIWEHDDGSTLVRTESWSLPVHLHKYVNTIQPTNSWARLQKSVPVREIRPAKPRARSHEHYSYSWAPWSATATPTPTPSPSPPPPPPPTVVGPSAAEVAAACNFSAVTPNCLRVLYGTINYTPASDSASQLGVCNYLGEYNNRSDAYQFLSIYRPEAADSAYTFPQISVAGGAIDNGTKTADDAGTGLEGNLDAEYMLGIGYPLTLTAWSTGGRNPSFMPDLVTTTNSDEPFLTWLDYILAQKDIPQMISTSYGDDEQTVSLTYAQSACNEFAQLGARGVTMLFASGDFGVGTSGLCYSNADNTTYEFLPSFPDGCPYVTSVGGTTGFPEVAMNTTDSAGDIIASGGGFSIYFERPNYQRDTVGKYVAGLDGLYDGYYNRSGRAYPDIACQGQIFPVIWNGTRNDLVGTSGSTPICAAVLGFANDALLAAGRPTLGFLNPWLYSGGYEAFTDVTEGYATGCNVTGFPAVPGWDAVTGFGTPYLPRLLENLGFGLEDELAEQFRAVTGRDLERSEDDEKLYATMDDFKDSA